MLALHRRRTLAHVKKPLSTPREKRPSAGEGRALLGPGLAGSARPPSATAAARRRERRPRTESGPRTCCACKCRALDANADDLL
jgi:hypothetical protein